MLEAELDELQSESKLLVRILGNKKTSDHSAVYQRFLICQNRIDTLEQQLMILGRML